ncbi:Helix-turn-helix family protein [Carnobacterium maltaromaticum]|uniref:helix-turn-helix domain-containing protein n=1 Tax=Carnobacterium maltaromaticum TaxID=2751 RepID=UPI0007052EFE|nr:helix-turn-helix transcriptional regulator [Carnobacterium maltaromaticum]KRN71707.1 XRE family DNA-binding protein [Carnobacterium maltaromaticum]MBC9808983.1 helix-turn-helix domain-containing protein [Carnobacterium maltaromaticum]CRH17494.1 Helix-turn-helix family protein [Carnobacterium maltaromaticum]
MNIGDKIKEQRLRKELTQEQLSALLNVSRSTVSSWEVGRNYPDLETIVAISDLFGISLDNLLREDTTMTKNLSNKLRWNGRYKKILLVIGILFLIYAGFNLKLRLDEKRYLTNISAHSWKNDDIRYLGGYVLKEKDITYSTYIMENGFNPIPLKENSPWVIARKDPLVVKVKQGNKLYIVISKANDPKVTYDATVEVDNKANLFELDPEWSNKKQKAIVDYLKKYQTDYIDLLKRAVNERKAIVS